MAVTESDLDKPILHMEDSVETNADAINSQSGIKNQEDKTDEASEREEKNESPLDPSDPAPVNEWNEDWLLLAATYINDATAGRNSSFKPDGDSLRSYKLFNHIGMKIGLLISLWGLLLLAVFETPAVHSVALPYWGTMILEILFLCFLIFRVIHNACFAQWSTFWRDAKHITVIVVVVLTLVDMLGYVLWINFSSPNVAAHAVRWSRSLRVFFLVNVPEGRQLRKAFRNIRRTLPDIFHVLVLFFASIAIFALLALKLLDVRNLSYSDGRPYFQNYFEGLWDLYVLVTTANNPDVMMPAYDYNNWFALLFGVYVVVNLYIFMNIVLAVVYNNYKKHLKNEVKSSVYIKRRLLSNAFNILKTWKSSKYVVTTATWHAIMANLCPSRSRTQTQLLLSVLDDDGDGNIEKHEFLKVADILAINIVEVEDIPHMFRRLFPIIYNNRLASYLHVAILSKYFQFTFDLLILANAICIGLNFEQAEYFFLPVFSLEVSLRLYALGPTQFFHGFWNIFDFVVISAAVIFTIIFSALDLYDKRTSILDILMVLRVLRLVRLGSMFNRFQVVLTTIVNIGPSITTYGCVIFVIYYIYAIIGMELFKGLIQYHGYENQTNASLLFCGSAKLNSSEFSRKHYCGNNFNDIFHAFVLLFELTVVNQWHVLTSGFVLVTHPVARLYFISFHMVCVLIILNIFTAFVLEVFILEFNLCKSRLQSTIEARIKDMGLGFGQTPVRSGRDVIKLDKKVLVDSMEEDDSDTTASTSSQVTDHVVQVNYGDLDNKKDENTETSGTKHDNEIGLRFVLEMNTRKRVTTLLEYMFEGEIEPTDEGPEEVLDNEGIVFEERPPTLETI